MGTENLGLAFHIENFGCRAARADGEAMSERLRANGLSEAEPTAAEVVIVNTCSVTAEADRAARSFIRRTHRVNPAARILVTGCYAQRAPEELAGIHGVAAVIGNSHKALTPEIALHFAGEAPPSERQVTSTNLIPVRTLLASDRAQHPFPRLTLRSQALRYGYSTRASPFSTHARFAAQRPAP